MAVINNGRLLSQIDPKTATEKLKGKIWETGLTEKELTESSMPFLKLSDRYNEDNRLVNRFFAEQCPAEACISVNPKLEDFYFLTLNRA